MIVFIVIMTYLCGLIATALFDTHTVPHGSITSDASDTYVSDDQGWEPAYVFSYGKNLATFLLHFVMIASLYIIVSMLRFCSQVLADQF